jgi:hypothetical protein
MANMTLPGLAALGLLVSATPLYAHHGTAGYYNRNKTVDVQGTVKAFWWRNPHSELLVDAKDDSGKAVTYALDLGSPQALTKFGYTRSTFKPGDQVIMPMHPSFTNPIRGEALSREVTLNGAKLKDAAAPTGAAGSH